MRDSLFEREQSILLVGEGNFSFSVELVKLNLALKLTSCCFEKELLYSTTKENILFLKHKGVRVLQDVDATRLSEYEELNSCHFNRIVFNFPHVGGKTKIQLNRKLLCNFFESCSPLLSEKGAVIVSLCRGQGGSSEEIAPKQSADTWRVVEMAAHGGFVLAAVEAWDHNSSLARYSCVGRRSRDSSFRREGALVHIFRFAPVSFQFHTIDKYLNLLVPLQAEFSNGIVECTNLENNILKKDLLCGETSTLRSLIQSLVMLSTRRNYHTKTKKVSPVLANGLLQRTNELESFIKLQLENKREKELELLWSTAFNDVGSDFTVSPVSCYVAVLGSESLLLCQEWLSELGRFSEVSSDVLIKLHPNACLMFLDKLCLKLFHLSGWRELWPSGAEVVFDEKGSLAWQPVSISPSIFIFDLSVSSQEPPDIDAICYVLWQLAGEMVQNVEVVDTYESPEGWNSKCLRITYCSYELALHRSLVVKLQQEVIGPVLERHLGVTVR